MGLDYLEMVLAVEDEFQVALTDHAVYQCDTPGKLTDLLFTKLRSSSNDVCPSMRGFYRVRKAMMEYLFIPRGEIEPQSRLDALIGRKNRRETWNGLLQLLTQEQAVHAPLKRPVWIKIISAVLTVLAFIAILHLSDSLALAVIGGIALSALAYLGTTALKREFAGKYVYVRDLIPIVGSLDSRVWERDELYRRVKTLVAEQSGVDESEVHPDSHFIDDLGMG